MALTVLKGGDADANVRAGHKHGRKHKIVKINYCL